MSTDKKINIVKRAETPTPQVEKNSTRSSLAVRTSVRAGSKGPDIKISVDKDFWIK